MVVWNICAVQSARISGGGVRLADRARRGRSPTEKGWRTNKVNRYLLADHISRVLVNEAGRPVASEALVHFAFVPLEPGGTHALHVPAAGQRAGPGVDAVVMADVCPGRAREEVRHRDRFERMEVWLELHEALIEVNYPHQMTS